MGDTPIWDLVVASHSELTEGPMWEESSGTLYWVSILGHEVHSWCPSDGSRGTWNLGEFVGAVVPRKSGGLVVAVQRGFATLDPVTGGSELLREVEADRPNQRMNDGKCDPSGRLWAGTMGAAEAVHGSGTLYRLDTDWSVTPMVDGLTISNGLGWSPDGGTMYFVDTGPRCLFAFDFDPEEGRLSRQRVLVTFQASDGYPDGLCMDAEGCVWLAMWGAGRINRYSPSGILIESLSVPVTCPSSCAFGTSDLDVLFVTSASLTLDARERSEQPDAGGIFAVDVGVPGLPIPPFGG